MVRDFSTHFKMEEKDVVKYVKEIVEFFPPEARLRVDEIGDGNINYVYRIVDEESGKSIVIKHADVELRSNPGRLLDLNRNRIEAEILDYYSKQVPEYVPEIYFYDQTMYALSMEDISDHGNLRNELLQRKTFPFFADHITTFMVHTLLPSTDLVMDPWQKKKNVERYINIELCDISEKLVFTEPYTNHDCTNIILDENKSFVDKEIYEDSELVLEAGKLKNSFMNNAQALIHGDLHTGSIFVKENSTKVIDPEFAFYGPMGYDLGNVVGNLFFPWMNAYFTMENGTEKDNFLNYIENTVKLVLSLFCQKFRKLYSETVSDVMAKQAGYLDWYLGTVLENAAGTAGLEIIRRTVGDAKVADITGIEQRDKRIEVERALIRLGKRFIKERKSINDGDDYLKILKELIG